MGHMRTLCAALALTAGALAAAPVCAEIDGVRTGIHPDYVRVVFESPDAFKAAVEREAGRIRITLPQPIAEGQALPDVADDFAPYVKQWSLDTSELNATFWATLQAGVDVKVNQSERLTYIDFLRPPGAQDVQDLSDVSSDVAAIRSATQSMNEADENARQAAKEAALKDAMAAQENQGDEASADQAQRSEDVNSAKAALSGEAQRSRLEQIDVMLQNRPYETRLTYHWDVSVPAAVFQRAGSLWVVFENDVRIEHPGVVFSETDRITGVERIVHPFGTVLRYSLAPDQSVVAQRENTRWEIEVKDSITRPRDPVVMTRQNDPIDGKRAFFALGEAGSRFVFDDSLVGDTLIVVPSSIDGKGVAARHSAAGYTALQTAQGVAFAQLGDGVDVRRYRNGAAVYSTTGLALSETGAELATANGQRAVRLIDLAGWAGDPDVPEPERNMKLLYDISMAPEVNLNDRRAAYARFLVGRGFAVDALGVMQVMTQADPTLEGNPTLLAMRGVGRLLARRFEGAYTDLMAPALDSEPDAYLWRAVAAEATGRYSEALTYFDRGADVLSLYDAEDQARFQLTAVRAAEALKRADVAAIELERLESLEAPSPYKEWGQLLRARRLLTEGDSEAAKRILGVLSVNAPRAVQARARYDLASLALEEEAATPQETIEQLERLRFAWRGDAFELDLLETLSQLYWDTKNYREALGALRQAVTYFPINDRTRAIGGRMEQLFTELFLGGTADDMDPVSAVALYYDFRELTPLGSAGDTMVRRLADRLVNVELFDRAAQLLEHQVTYRLDGVAQASVAARLAMVHLLNDNPADALRVLRATRAGNIPKDLRAERFRIEARALIDTKRYQEAIVAIEADSTPQADMLRADAAWGGKDWNLVRTTASALLDGAGETLSDDERRHVLRWAIAATLDNVPGELGQIRKDFGARMRKGLYSEAFEAIAGSTDANGMAIPRLSGNLADVDTLEAFMDSYRAAFRPGSSAAGDDDATSR